MANISVNLSKNRKQIPASDALGFGVHFTDHMLVMDYNLEQGWHDIRIEPYGPVQFEPSMMALHYGQAIFEGMKAFRAADGNINLFRARDHFRRFNNSARRVCIPEIDVEELLAGLKKLLEIDNAWVPSALGTALYIRPFIFATDQFLGVRPSHTYKLMIILSPVGAYYAEGFNPVKIMVEDQFVRAVRGGIGEIKTPGNYAASLLAAVRAKEKGFTQVLWLDAHELKWLEEVGTMNIMVKIDDQVITPPLNGSILPGVTRDSTIKILEQWHIPVLEKQISIDEVMQAGKNGRLQEMFGTGTAAVISPVGSIHYKEDSAVINHGVVGELSQKLFNEITGIQYGTRADTNNWIDTIKVSG
ncbi:MAG: branched-chain amino acid aminotransferase [Deltaproteobacteria bacterium]|nr:branched-chain amino acid aminotransferase [Deltaproteobacteria bacterium]